MRPDLGIVHAEGSRVDAVIDKLWAIPRDASADRAGRRDQRRARARAEAGRAAPADKSRLPRSRERTLPREIEEAYYRDLGDPLLRYLRRITAEPGTVVVVVMPELIFTGPQRLLHNQRALYVKRLLLFEPHVILTGVPYRLS